MNTVKEFEALGGAMASGDKVAYNNLVATWSNRDGWSSNSSIFNELHLKSFAWRTNTGVKPEFMGLIDYEVIGGTPYSASCQSVIFGIPGDGNMPFHVIKWRPHLAQSLNFAGCTVTNTGAELGITIETPEEKEALDKMKTYDFDGHVSDSNSPKANGESVGEISGSKYHGFTAIGSNANKRHSFDFCNLDAVKMESAKPVFTQAMADAGERVKVGMLFSTATGKYTALMVNDSQVVFERGSLGFVVETHAFIHPIDTKTDKEKAVDEMLKSLETFDNEFVQLNKYEAGKLYDLGYRK